MRAALNAGTVILAARKEESVDINGFVCDTKHIYAHYAHAVHTKKKQVIANRHQKSHSRSHNTAKQELTKTTRNQNSSLYTRQQNTSKNIDKCTLCSEKNTHCAFWITPKRLTSH